MSKTLWILGLSLAAQTAWAADGFRLSSDELRALTRLAPGQQTELSAVPVAKNRAEALKVKRIDIYAPDARIYVIDDKGQREVPRSDWQYFVAQRGAGAAMLGFGISPDGRQVQGTLINEEGTYELRGQSGKQGLDLDVIDTRSLVPKGRETQFTCGGSLATSRELGVLAQETLPGLSKAVAGGSRQAVIAVDTDNELMLQKFSNNTSSATTYLGQLFTAMNAIYTNDVDLTLVQGTTFLRVSTTPDPFNNNDTSATQAQLVEFGNFWSANQAGTSRVLAMLISGKSSSQFSSSGIAWLLDSGNYCTQRNGTGGAYSVSQVFKFSGATGSTDVQVVAHELGHNFGLAHTHCTSQTGTQPASTNTLDACFTGESGLGCFGGTQVCPASASGRTLMSYCHLQSPGGTTCGSVTLAFHPVQITVLNSRIAANLPSCITSAGAADTVFANGFE